MMKKSLILFVAVLSIFICSTWLSAAEEDATKVAASFEFGYRYVDVSGNINKYNEDLNYQKGPRLLNLSFEIVPSGTLKKYFDVFNVTASALGGDPYESYGFVFKKYGAFNLRYNHRKATYFNHDTLLTPSMAYYRLSNVGDLHTFNFEHAFEDLYFDVNLSERAKFFIAYDRQKLSGESTTTLDIQRDEFEFDKPVDNLKNAYRAGLQVNLDRVDFVLEGNYTDYKNQNSLFLPGYSAGENPAYSDLSLFELMVPYKFTMPMITAKINARPTNRLKATLAYSYANQDMSLSYGEKAKGSGPSPGYLPVAYETAGNADLSRKLSLFNFDLSFKVHEKVYLIGGFRYNKLSQTGDLTVEAERFATAADIKNSIYEAGVQILPHRNLSISGGIRFEDREAKLKTGDEAAEPRETKRTTFFINANYDFSKKVSLLGEYERGSYKEPFTIMSPTGLDRFKIRGKVKATPELSFVFTMLKREMKNSDSGGTFKSDTYSVDAVYTVKEKFTISGGYARLNVNTSINNPVAFASVIMPWDIKYKSGNNVFQGSLSYKVNPKFSIGAMSYYYKNAGTWALDWTTLKGWVRYTLNGGYSLVLSYQRNNYNEATYNFDDYSSDILTLGFGYRF